MTQCHLQTKLKHRKVCAITPENHWLLILIRSSSWPQVVLILWRQFYPVLCSLWHWVEVTMPLIYSYSWQESVRFTSTQCFACSRRVTHAATMRKVLNTWNVLKISLKLFMETLISSSRFLNYLQIILKLKTVRWPRNNRKIWTIYRQIRLIYFKKLQSGILTILL